MMSFTDLFYFYSTTNGWDGLDGLLIGDWVFLLSKVKESMTPDKSLFICGPYAECIVFNLRSEGCCNWEALGISGKSQCYKISFKTLSLSWDNCYKSWVSYKRDFEIKVYLWGSLAFNYSTQVKADSIN